MSKIKTSFKFDLVINNIRGGGPFATEIIEISRVNSIFLMFTTTFWLSSINAKFESNLNSTCISVGEVFPKLTF